MAKLHQVQVSRRMDPSYGRSLTRATLQGAPSMRGPERALVPGPASNSYFVSNKRALLFQASSTSYST